MLPQPPHRRPGVGAKPHVCNHCGQSFRRTEHLERHIRTHTKEKPFACFCAASFTRRDLLKRHQRISHQDTALRQHTASEGQKNALPTADRPALQPQYDAHTSPVQQWTNMHIRVESDAEMLPAAQFLLPTDYQNTPQLLPTNIGEELNYFQEFTHFLTSIGLPTEWVPTDGDPFRTPDSSEVTEINRPAPDQQVTSRGRQPERPRADSPFRSWLPSVPPADQSIGTIWDYEPPQIANKFLPLKVSEDQKMRLAASLEEFQHVIADFALPSQHTLTRYLTSFFKGFYSHLPFIHVPTFQVNERAPELVLGFLAIGAQYQFEHRNAERLFHASKAIVLERLSTESRSTPCTAPMPPHSVLVSQPPGQASPLHPSEATGNTRTWTQMEMIRCLLVLMAYATWERAELVQEAFSLLSVLVPHLRKSGLTENTASSSSHSRLDWREWAEDESVRRTKLIAFCFVHIHSVTYNIYPVLRSSEINLRLPCSTEEWNASNANEWQDVQRNLGSQQLCFQDALGRLLKSHTIALLNPIPAPLGSYILLHGLLQRIHLVNELALPNEDRSVAIPTEELNRLERALRSWTAVWQQAPESSLDPHNENGPIPFTSSALLGLAYVRLCLNLGPYRQLETRDPSCIAAALHRSPLPERSYRLIPALICAAHSLSIPVRLGIDYVARSQAFFWSVRHSLASLECAVLLSKWLHTLAEPENDQTLSENESRILRWTRRIVQEAYSSIDLDESSSPLNLNPAGLGLSVIKLWARLFRQNTQWPFVNILGLSLEKYAAMIQLY